MLSDATFTQVKNAFQSISGLESLTAADEFFLQNSMNRSARRAYNESNSWPRYLVVSEERDIVPFGIIGTTGIAGIGIAGELINQNYALLGTGNGSGAEAAGTLVYSGLTNAVVIYNSGSAWIIDQLATTSKQDDGTYVVNQDSPYEFIEADTVKKDNVLDVENWERIGGANDILPTFVAKDLIPYAQSGRNTIGEFIRIHRKRAFLNNSAIEYEFFADADGANILNQVNTTDNTAFVTYKKSATFDFNPDSTDIPDEFVDYMIHSALADFYMGDGQTEKVSASKALAKEALDYELERAEKAMNNNTVNKRFSTYVNRQSR